MADADDITLSPRTHTAVQGVTRARHELEGWEHNLRSALTEDVEDQLLTADQAEDIAKSAQLKDFKAPKPGDAPQAVETTAEMNEAQRLAHEKEAKAEAKADQEVAAKAAPEPEPESEPAPPKANDEKKKGGR